MSIYLNSKQKLIPSIDFLKSTILSGPTWLSLTYGGVATPFQWSDGKNKYFPEPLKGEPWSSTSDMNKWGYGTNCNSDTDVKFDHVIIDPPTNSLPPSWKMVRACPFVMYRCVCQLTPC